MKFSLIMNRKGADIIKEVDLGENRCLYKSFFVKNNIQANKGKMK